MESKISLQGACQKMESLIKQQAVPAPGESESRSGRNLPHRLREWAVQCHFDVKMPSTVHPAPDH
jgi:hypothetical protein